MFIWLTSITDWIISASIADGIISVVFNILTPILLPIAFLLIVD